VVLINLEQTQGSVEVF